jgi:BMFP domain-containing protein YqiC
MKRKRDVSEHIWETFDSLFKTVHRQGRRVEELEARLESLERRLEERSAAAQQQATKQPPHIVNEMPAERAA